MLPGMELMGCTGLAVPAEVMHHVVAVESAFNPFAIGVVGGRLARQPRTLAEALSTSRMLEREGYNFSLGLAQVNRHNFAAQGLETHEQAFDACPNLRAGSRILADCHTRAAGDWGKAFSCYYSGNFTTGFRHGYVQKVLASWQGTTATGAIPLLGRASPAPKTPAVASRVQRRVQEAALAMAPPSATGHATSVALPTVDVGQLPETGRPATDDAPVTVRRTGAPVPRAAPPGSDTPQAGPRPSGDTAFVF